MDPRIAVLEAECFRVREVGDGAVGDADGDQWTRCYHGPDDAFFDAWDVVQTPERQECEADETDEGEDEGDDADFDECGSEFL